MYVAVRGGEQAIAASWDQLAGRRRGDPKVPALTVAQIRTQLPDLVDRVMADSGVADTDLAALSIRQAGGDPIEAGFLLRAYRTTLPRFGDSQALDTGQMRIVRRVSSIFKDLPGGQVLGPTADYTQRLLDFSLLDEAHNTTAFDVASEPADPVTPSTEACPEGRQSAGDALGLLGEDDLIEQFELPDGDPDPVDVTREPAQFPVDRATWLQMLARADEGWILGMGYATQRGYAHTHPFTGDLRIGAVPLVVVPDELGFALTIGELVVTECQMVSQFAGSAAVDPQFTRGYGLTLGHTERKSMAMALVDRALRADELNESRTAPVQDAEFVLSHSDSVEASGFVQHLKLPHYVTFAAESRLLSALRRDRTAGKESETP